MDNEFYFADVLASLYFYINTFSTITRDEIINIINGDLKFWIKNGLFTYNQNRAKIIYDLCKKYGFRNKGFDHINSLFYELKRENHEVFLFEKIISNF